MPFDYLTQIQRRLEQGAGLRMDLARSHASVLAAIALAVRECLERNGKILVFGNGGSASQAQHFAAELVGRFRNSRRALPALALTADSAILTAIANDYGFENVFSRQIEALGFPPDLVIALSTSGRSPNVLQGMRAARAKGLRVVAFSGKSGMAAPSDLELAVPITDTALAQEMHLAALHLVCELIENCAQVGKECVRASKIVDYKILQMLRTCWRRDGKTVVWTNGCFDILHAGHLRCLTQAKALGDVLIVGINSDSSVRTLKGPSRPIIPLAERMELVAGLECVDSVTPLEQLTPESVLAELQPEIHCKGGDYGPPPGKPLPEMATVFAYGGRMEFISTYPGLSSSSLVRRICAAEEKA